MRVKYPQRLYKSGEVAVRHGKTRWDDHHRHKTPHLTTYRLKHSMRRLLKLSALLQTPTTLRSSANMTSAAGSAPKGNVGSRAMESILTSTSAGASPEEWQSFLIKTMNDTSAPLARNMLDKIGLNASTTTPFKLLDHGCGLGVVAPVLRETVPKDVMERSSVLCGDFSEALVKAVQGRIEKEGWVGCEAKVVDAQVCVSSFFLSPKVLFDLC